MDSAIIFALCLCSLVLPAASHRNSHAAAHEMPHLHQTYMGDDFIDVTTDSEFFGLTTFANVPYVNCLKAEETEGGRYDIAILGAPFDTVSRTTWILCHVLINPKRVSLVDPGLDSAPLGSAEDHSAWLQVMLGISTQVWTVFGSQKTHLIRQCRREYFPVMGKDRRLR